MLNHTKAFGHQFSIFHMEQLSVSGIKQIKLALINMFFCRVPPSQGSFGPFPRSKRDVCSDAAQQRLLTQHSKNIRRNKGRLSSQQPRPESSKQLTNPDVKSKLYQLPKHSYVTTLMGRWLLGLPRRNLAQALFAITYAHMLYRMATLFNESLRRSDGENN